MPPTKIRGNTQIIDATITDAQIAAAAAIASTKLANWSADRNAGGNKLTGLANGSASSDAVTYGQLQAAIQGYQWKDPARAASTTNLSVTYNATGGTSGRGQITGAPNTLDGVSLAANDRILIKDQSTGAQNGIYVVTTVGTGSNGVWDRATDADADGELESGTAVFVTAGTVNADTAWVITTDGTITVGGASGTATSWAQFSGAGSITAGGGLSKTGNQLDVNVDNATIEISTDALRVKDSGITAAKIAAAVAGAGLSGGAGSALAVNVDSVGIEIVTDTLQLKDSGVTTAKIANNAVTADKLPTSVAGAGIAGGGGSALSLDIVQEAPSGTVNGSNTAFTLTNTPITNGLMLFKNGQLLKAGGSDDYTISGVNITMATAPSSTGQADVLWAVYFK